MSWFVKPQTFYCLLVFSWLVTVCCGKGSRSEIRAAQDEDTPATRTAQDRVEESTGRSKPIPIILDTDIGTDIDDAYALVLAARNQQLRLLAVTTVYGKVDIRSAIARKLLLMMGKDKIPVASGASKAFDGHEPSWGGWEGSGLLAANEVVEGISKQSAADLIIDVLMDSNEKVVIVSVGGLTNVALALQTEPRIKEKIERVVIMGGCVQSIMIQGKRLPDRIETNLHNDVDAAASVLRSGLPISLVPADITFQTKLLKEDFDRIRQANSPLSDAMTKMTAIWEPIMKSGLKSMGVGEYHEDGVAMLHDPLAVSMLIDPTLVKIGRQSIRVELEKGTIRTPADDAGPQVIDVVTSVDIERLSRLVASSVLSNNEATQIRDD